MRARPSGAFVIALALLAGCGGHGPAAPSPLTPSPPTGTSTTQSIVAAAVSQAAINTAMTISPDGLSRTATFPCANGGSMAMTFNSTAPSGPPGTLTSSSRIEFNECRSQTVTINGDPAMMMEGAYTFVMGAGNGPSSMTSTTRMTGGVRFDAAGTPGRAKYDCTMTMSMSMQSGSDGPLAPPTMTSSGTITWEQPLGTVMVQPCGR